jgi:hypothetical protein
LVEDGLAIRSRPTVPSPVTASKLTLPAHVSLQSREVIFERGGKVTEDSLGLGKRREASLVREIRFGATRQRCLALQ